MHEQALDVLNHIELFRDLTEQELGVLARRLGVTELAPEEDIFREGEPGHFMSIVGYGKIAVLKQMDAESMVRIAEIGPGRTFGEMALLDGERRSATCRAVEPSRILTLSRAALDQILQDMPSVGVKVIKSVAATISRRLRETDSNLVQQVLAA